MASDLTWMTGAGVFSAGTTYWTCGLDSTCPRWDTPAQTSAALQQITLNLLRAFAVPRSAACTPVRRRRI